MRIDNLECFLALAETLNYTEAASRLFITQSALSRTIQQMEEELGMELFSRSRRNVCLTPAGRSFAKDCERMVSQYYRGVERARSVEEGTRGNISFGCHSITISPVTLDILSCFHSRYAEIAIQVEAMPTSQLVYAINEEKIECAVSTGVSQKPEVKKVLLQQYRDCLVVAASHPLAGRERVSVKELRELKFAVMSRESSVRGHNAVMNCCWEAGFDPDIAVRALSVPHLLTILSMGEHVSILSENYRQAAGDRLAFIPLEKEQVTSLYFMWNTKSNNPSLKLFAEYVEQNYGKTEYL